MRILNKKAAAATVEINVTAKPCERSCFCTFFVKKKIKIKS